MGNDLSVHQADPPVAAVVQVALYTRVSTADQNCQLQQRELGGLASPQGWHVVEVYQDVMSGASARRPGLTRLMADAAERRFRCVLVWKLDRFGRSLVDCLSNIQTLETCGVRFIAVTQGLDTDQRNPASRFMLQVLGAAAEFERSLIRERSLSGQMRYRQDSENGRVGKTVHSRSDRDLPPHRPRKIFDRDEVVTLHRQGYSLRQIATRLGLGLGTVTRTLKERSETR
jgi:DNA invertase Pin-like site-specific DNA recombinase